MIGSPLQTNLITSPIPPFPISLMQPPSEGNTKYFCSHTHTYTHTHMHSHTHIHTHIFAHLHMTQKCTWSSSSRSLICLRLYLYLSVTALSCSSNCSLVSISSLVSVTWYKSRNLLAIAQYRYREKHVFYITWRIYENILAIHVICFNKHGLLKYLYFC